MRTETGEIIAGHGRILAAQKRGFTDAPCMTAVGWSPEQIKAYRIADNKLTENSTWDEDLLKAELTALEDIGFDLTLTGFNLEEINLLVDGGVGQGLTDPDDAPEPPANPVSALGDVWLLGAHRLMCGDSRSLSETQQLCAGIIPDLANCDPPYGISVVKSASVGGAKPFGQTGHVGRSDTHAIAFGKLGARAASDPKHIANYGKTGGGNAPYGGWKDGDRTKGPAKQGRVHGPARRAIIAPGLYAPIIGDDSTETAVATYGVLTGIGACAIVLWGGNYFANALPPSRCWLVWDKENTGTFADAELAWTNQDAVVRVLRHQWSGLMKASERGEKRVAPTQKPVALAEWVIETVSPKAKSVLDLFGGSGSTLIACERLSRSCFMMEISPHYCDVIIERWRNFTGKQATHEKTGRTFDEIAADRTQAVAAQ